MGRLTADPTVRYSEQTAIATFTIAIDRPPRDGEERKADFPRITAFGKQAESIEKYLKKGQRVIVLGRIQTGSYEDKDGKKIFTTDVIASRVEFIDFATKKDDEEAPSGSTESFEDVEDDIPF